MKYLLAPIVLLLAGCATVNFQSVNLSCPNLPDWALIPLIACAILGSGGFVISEWMSLSKKTEANGIIQYLLPLIISAVVWIKDKFSKKDPPK